MSERSENVRKMSEIEVAQSIIDSYTKYKSKVIKVEKGDYSLEVFVFLLDGKKIKISGKLSCDILNSGK